MCSIQKERRLCLAPGNNIVAVDGSARGYVTGVFSSRKHSRTGLWIRDTFEHRIPNRIVCFPKEDGGDQASGQADR